jgi:putative flippase GtrA
MQGTLSRAPRLLASVALFLLTGCLGTVVGSAVDVTLEVAKVPFKVAGAAVDVVNGDDDEDDK